MTQEPKRFLPRTLRMVYLKEKSGRWLTKSEVSEFSVPAPADFAAMHDPRGQAPFDQWLTLAQIRAATTANRESDA